ncbi:carbohydrate porin [Schlesneria sp. DSM 10557]|uniref:carbohydrate porin n=1 Tax=Schlesneria sp. DSM 10557 TaxID=3044399 RepID=UPI0035A04BA0
MRCFYGKPARILGFWLALVVAIEPAICFAYQPYDDEVIIEPKSAPYPDEGDLQPDVDYVPIDALVPLLSESALAAGTPPLEGPLFSRKTLTGEWGGARTRLRESGITADLSTTQFYQGVASGGLNQVFRYGGRNDYFVNIDGEKAGLWKGAFVTLHGETRYGETIDKYGGTFMPPNLMLDVPQAYGSVTALTEFKLTQFLSESFLVYGGRLNMFDTFVQPITGATALNGFMNTAMMFNPVYARTVPYSTYGAGFAVLKDLKPVFSAAVVDTHNTPTVTGFNTLFDNGVTLLAELKVPTQFFGMPGHQGVAGTYSTGSYSDLEPTPYFDPIAGLGLIASKQHGSWCFTYGFDQALYTSPSDPRKVWGVFGNFGVSDANPNPVPTFFNVGLSGTSLIPQRLQDSCGFGYYYVEVSESLKDLAPRVLRLQDEQGVELYYNYQVNPWFHVTPDIQLVSPFRERAETAVIAGVRAKVDF